MDIIFNLVLIFVIITLFFALKYSANPYLNVGIIVFACLGLVITISSPLYIITGTNSTFNYDTNGTLTSGEVTNLTQSLGSYNYIIQLFYIVGLIGGIMYWGIENPRKKEDY